MATNQLNEFIEVAKQNSTLFEDILKESIKNNEDIMTNEILIDLRGHVEQLKKRIEYYISTTELNNVEEKSLSLLFEIHSTIDNSLCKHCNYTNEGGLFTPLIQVQQ